MRGATAALVAALIATNAGWAAYVAFGRGVGERVEPGPSAPATPPAAPSNPAAAAAPAVPPAPAGATLAPSPTAPRSPRLEAAPASAPPAPRVPDPRVPTTPDARTAAAKAAEGWKQSILQIQDAARRDQGLRGLADALRGSDPSLARAALAVLPSLRGIEFDHDAFREMILPHLRSTDPGTVGAAAWALTLVKSQPGDADLLLAAIGDDPEALRANAFSLLTLAGSKVEGRVADVFVRLLANPDDRQAENVANLLRSVPSTLEVQQAAVAAWERHRKSGRQDGAWHYILGQLEPLREPAVRAIFAAITAPDATWDGGLFTGRIARNVASEARPLAASLAADGLGNTTEAAYRKAMVDVLAAYGSRAETDALQRFAGNALVPEGERQRAREVIDLIGKR